MVVGMGYSVQLRTQTRRDMGKMKIAKEKTSRELKIVKNKKQKKKNEIIKKFKNIMKRMHSNMKIQHEDYEKLKQEYEEDETFNDDLWFKHLDKLKKTEIEIILFHMIYIVT